MKRMLEKIKANKVRSTLIGLSAFLFGFISVSIFNSIGDTYAVTEDTKSDGKCYYCQATNEYSFGESRPEKGCASTWITNDMLETECKTAANKLCWYCEATGEYIYEASGFRGTCGSGWIRKHHFETYCLAQNNYTGKPEQGDGADPSTGSSSNSGNGYVVANTKNYYAITYDLDGGHFIDGSTERTEYVIGSNPVGNMKTNPVKKGYAFVEWRYNGKAFDFSKPLDDMGLKYENQEDKYIDITLKAHYEEYTDQSLYCKNEEAELDYATGMCYTVLKEDASKEIYTHTTYLYKYQDGVKNERFCYAYNDKSAGDETPGGIYWRSDIANNIQVEVSGKKDKTDGVYAEYKGKDYWLSKETCRIGAPCYITSQATDYPAESCEVTYSAILYHEEDALVKEPIDVPDENKPDTPSDGNDENKPDTPSDGNDGNQNDGVGGGNEEEPDDKPTNDKPSNDKTDEDLTDKDAADLKTGDALIIIAWLVGLGALGYTAYYFIKKNKEN